VVRYPHAISLQVIGSPSGFPTGRFLDADGREVGLAKLASLSQDFFTIATDYRLVTPKPFGILVIPAADAIAPALPGLIESWWYPKPLFVVFRAPPPGEPLAFRRGDPLCSIVPVPADVRLEEVDVRGRDDLERMEGEYESYRRKRTDLQWSAASGRTFSHAYRWFGKDGGYRQ
jgi:hypothetical protein